MLTITIIGSGVAGHTTALALRRRLRSRARILLLGEEGLGNLDRRQVPDLLEAQDPTAAAACADQAWYAEHGIEAHLDDGVVFVNRERRQVATARGLRHAYDHLIFATGAMPKLPDLAGRDAPNVLTLRSWDDVVLLRRAMQTRKRIAVIGGGPLGVSAAYRLADQGALVTLVESASSWCLRQVDRSTARCLDKTLAGAGVALYAGHQVVRLVPDGGQTNVVLSGGKQCVVDIVVLTCGAQARDELASACQLRRSFDGGIRIDECMGTDDPRISAVGECARFGCVLMGGSRAIELGAEVIATNLSGEVATFNPPSEEMCVQLGADFCWSTGEVHGQERDQALRWRNGTESRTIVFRDAHLVGACGFGGRDAAVTLAAAVSRGLRLWPWQLECFRSNGTLWADTSPFAATRRDHPGMALHPTLGMV